MFTRANFDIKGNPTCCICTKAKATRIVTNTTTNHRGDLGVIVTAFCINCWNDTNQDTDEVMGKA